MRIGRDEIDIVALEPGPSPTLVFVEVRTKTTDRYGTPEESVSAAKVRSLYRAAFALRASRVLARAGRSVAWRIDLVTVRDRGPDARPLVRHLRGVADR